MARTVVKLNLAGVNALMRSRPVQALVRAEAEEIAGRAGPDFEAVDAPHRWTARAYVRARDIRGMRAEAKGKVLTRAVTGG